MWLHAIDLYLEDKPSEYWSSRFTKYRDWMDDPRIEPLGNVYRGPLKFSTAMVTNPDNTMYQWNKISPTLIDLRNSAQSVSLLLVGTAR